LNAPEKALSVRKKKMLKVIIAFFHPKKMKKYDSR